MRNSILTNNQATTGPDCTGTLNSDGYNIVSDTSDCSISGSSGDLLNVNAGLYHQFGSPPTIAFMQDSPALDSGNPAGCRDHLGNSVEKDQIDTPRPLDGDKDSIAICDIGAFEYNPDHPPQWVFLPMIMK